MKRVILYLEDEFGLRERTIDWLKEDYRIDVEGFSRID